MAAAVAGHAAAGVLAFHDQTPDMTAYQEEGGEG